MASPFHRNASAPLRQDNTIIRPPPPKKSDFGQANDPNGLLINNTNQSSPRNSGNVASDGIPARGLTKSKSEVRVSGPIQNGAVRTRAYAGAPLPSAVAAPQQQYQPTSSPTSVLPIPPVRNNQIPMSAPTSPRAGDNASSPPSEPTSPRGGSAVVGSNDSSRPPLPHTPATPPVNIPQSKPQSMILSRGEVNSNFSNHASLGQTQRHALNTRPSPGLPSSAPETGPRITPARRVANPPAVIPRAPGSGMPANAGNINPGVAPVVSPDEKKRNRRSRSMPRLRGGGVTGDKDYIDHLNKLIGGKKSSYSKDGEDDEEEEIEEVFADDFFLMPSISIEVTEPRDRVAHEVFTSEQNFNLYLRVCIHLWKNPMMRLSKKGALGGFKPEAVTKLFGVLESIYGTSTFLLGELEQRIRAWSPQQKIGDIFVTLGDLLRVFAIYTKDHEAATQTLIELKENPHVQAFFAKKLALPQSGNRGLGDFLIMPVQRVPRYELLLRDLIKQTAVTHPDYNDLNAALEKVKSIATVVDASVASRKRTEKLFQIEKMFVTSPRLLIPGREFIKEGTLVKVCRSDKKKRYFFLFSDVLMYALPLVAGKLTMSAVLNLEGLIVEDVPDSEKQPNAFTVASSSKSFVVLAETKEEKAEWMQVLNSAAYKAREKKSTFTAVPSSGGTTPNASGAFASPPTLAPVWQHDSESTKCTQCSKSFSLIQRRHHCRQCGALVCDGCSSHRAALIAGESKVRVCDRCWSQLPQQK